MLRIVRLIRRKTLHGSSRGATLVEVLIAIAVLGLITSSIMPVMLMLNKSEFKWTEQTVAESLIRTQIEFIKGMDYNNLINYVEYDTEDQRWELWEDKTVDPPDPSYEIDVVVRPIHIEPSIDPLIPPGHTYLPSGPSDLPSDVDECIAEVTVEIYHVEKLVISTKNYKYNPNCES